MAITASMVKSLRESTGAGMMDCKNALAEAAEAHTDENALLEAAVEILRKKGMAKAAKRLDRETSEGRVVCKQEGKHIMMLSVTCETDFVSRNDDFAALCDEIINHAWSVNAADLDALLASTIDGKSLSDFLAEKTGSIGEKIEIKHYINLTTTGTVTAYIHSNYKVGTFFDFNTASETEDIITFGKDVAMHIAAMKPIALDRKSVDSSLIEKELEIIKDQLRNEGKAEDMLEKIAAGKLNRFYKDSVLLEQIFVKSEDGKTVEKEAKTYDSAMTFNGFVRFAIGE
jgi:elongation factor Ts